MKSSGLLALAITAIAACGHPAPPTDTDARAPGPVEGEWAITWSCVECQPGQINPLAYADSLVIAAATATYDNPECADCGDEHAGAPSADGTCFDVDGGGAGGGELSWDAYQLCSFGNTIEGQLIFAGYPGPPEARTYALSGNRP